MSEAFTLQRNRISCRRINMKKDIVIKIHGMFRKEGRVVWKDGRYGR